MRDDVRRDKVREARAWLRAAARRCESAAITWSGAPARAASVADVLRLVQIAVLGALLAALGAELAAALAAQRASPPRLFSPPLDALHPFLPVFVGMLLLPALIGGLALALSHVYPAVRGARRIETKGFASFAVAVRGAVPLYLGLGLLPLPAGEVAAVAGLALSVLAWAGGYARVLGVRTGHGAQLFGVGVLAAFGVLPLVGALLATLA